MKHHLTSDLPAPSAAALWAPPANPSTPAWPPPMTGRMTSSLNDPAREPASEPRPDSGWSLPEIIVAIALMGTVVLAIMGGMWAVIRASSYNDDQAKVQAVLGSAADRIANFKYLECPEDADQYDDYNAVSYARVGKAAVEAVGWSEDTIEIVNYEYWDPDLNGGAGGWSDSNTVQGTECNPTVGLTTLKTMQKVTVRVTAPNSGYSQQIDIVKSDLRPQEIQDVSTP